MNPPRAERTSLRSGDEPDPRFTLANERTYLAWIRTSLAFTAAAFGLEAIGDHVDLDAVWRTAMTQTMLAGAGVLAVGALLRWRRVEIAMRQGKPLPLPAAAPMLSAGLVILVVVASIALVV